MKYQFQHYFEQYKSYDYLLLNNVFFEQIYIFHNN